MSLTAPLPQPLDQRREDLTAWLISCFKKLLAEGSLRPGAKLPPERELAEMFGVSRSSLRQALKVLEIMGVITQQVSRGTYLNKNASEILGEPLEFLVLLDGLSHHELFETRMILEPELAARAARRATGEDLAALREALKRMKESLKDHARFAEADVAFHDALSQAAGNRVSQLVLQVLQRAMLTSIAQTSGLTKPENSIAFHRAIYRAIQRRDPDQARQKMIAHFEFGRDTLLRAAKEEPIDLGQKIRAIRRPVSAAKV